MEAPRPQDPIEEVFDSIQSLWDNETKLIHPDLSWPLYMGVGSSKQYGMAIMAYYVKGDPETVISDLDIPKSYEDNSSSLTA